MRTILNKKMLPPVKLMELISKYRFVLLMVAVGILVGFFVAVRNTFSVYKAVYGRRKKK